MALSKRQERRLHSLMRRLTFMDKATMDSITEWSPPKATREEYYEVYYLADLKAWSVDTLKVEWWKAQRAQYHNRVNYRSMPKSPRRDNKDVRVGSGGSNRNSVRFPREVRKTAWKRFWKLFPGLEGCRNWDDYHKKCKENPDTVYPLYQAPYKKQ